MLAKTLLKLSCLAVIAGAVAGCGVGDMETLRTAPRAGTVFQTALADAYLNFAESEAEQYDWPDSRHFARKGLAAAKGEDVSPEEPRDWWLPADQRGPIATAQGRLRSVMAAGSRRREPTLAAQAQSTYDCWLEQQEENHQARHIADCRDGLFAALDQLEGIVLAKREDDATTRYVVYFAFDQAQLAPEGRATLEGLTAHPQVRGAYRLRIEGHADRAGSDGHNLTLSLRRAHAVREALLRRGIDGGKVDAVAFGESHPQVPTADGVREKRNRRVEVVIEKNPVKVSSTHPSAAR